MDIRRSESQSGEQFAGVSQLKENLRGSVASVGASVSESAGRGSDAISAAVTPSTPREAI